MRAAIRPAFEALGRLLISSAQAHEMHAISGPQIFAVLGPENLQGMSSLAGHAKEIDVLLPEWISLADDGLGIAPIDRKIVLETLDFATTRNPDIQVAPVFEVPAYEDRRVAQFAGTIRSPEKRRDLILQLASFVRNSKGSGLTLSFDAFEQVSVRHYLDFVRELHAELKSSNLNLYQILANDNPPALLNQLSGYADAVIVKLALEHDYFEGEGPLASQSWFENQISVLTSQIPLDKVAITMVSTAVDWREDGNARRLSLQQAYRLAEEHSANPVTDAATKNSKFTYTDVSGLKHIVWMLDGVSAFHQLHSMRTNRPLGFALAKLGAEDASIWQLAHGHGTAGDPAILDIDTSTQIQYIGEGEVFSIRRLPRPGKRELIESNQESGASQIRMSQIPNGYEILLSGSSNEKFIALTFDDGPNAQFTPEILDVLSEYNVPATFFAIGSQMVKHPEIVERILAEGHNVGSHTFSHTNISSLDSRLLNVELNSTQSIFESISGRNLALFRAPFSVDKWPVTVGEIASLAAVSNNGYLSVSADIDPRDWEGVPADIIVNRVVKSVKSGVGQIIMMHDGGGNRTETVNALPDIITQLRQEGYRFVTAAEFLGQTADDVMPPAANQNQIYRAFVATGFKLMQLGPATLEFLFLSAIALGCSRALILIVLSFKKVKNKDIWAYNSEVSVGVVIPAYNEVEVIVKTVKSVLRSSHKNIAILVVDDGSTDDTYEHCRLSFQDNPKVQVITQNNAGKSAALNLGFSQLDTDIVVALDADTVFDEQAIPLMLGHFSDPEVAAVSGNAKVGNRGKLLTNWQALEYVVAQNLDRRAFEYLNCITVVPGAVGAWRRSAVLAAGGFGSDTLAEDAELTVRLLRLGHRVKYEEYAFAYTEAPETVREFSKQRLRWMFGMMQVGFKNLGALKLDGPKSVGLVAIPNILIFQILFPLIAPIADFAALCVLGDFVLKLVTNSNLIDLSDTLLFLGMFGAFMALDFISALVAFWHEKDEDRRLLFWLLPQRFFYRQLIYIAAIQSMVSAIRGEGVAWGHLRRTGSVISPAE